MGWVQREEARIEDYNRRAVEDGRIQLAKDRGYRPRLSFLYPPAPIPLCVQAFGSCVILPPHGDHCLLCGNKFDDFTRSEGDLGELKNNLGGGFAPLEVGQRHVHIWCLEKHLEWGCRGEYCHQGRMGNTCNTRVVTSTT